MLLKHISNILKNSLLRTTVQNSHCIVISDHAPCCLVYKDDRLTKDPPRWCFQHKWLQDKKFVKYVGKQIEEFFKINTTQTTACIRWEGLSPRAYNKLYRFKIKKGTRREIKFGEKK